MSYQCGQSSRRDMVLASPAVNGVDYLEVVGPPGCGTQLAVTFLKDATGLALSKGNITVSGGAPVTVTGITAATAPQPKVITVQLDRTGDFAPYTFALRAVAVTADNTVTVTQDPPDGIDPVLSTVTFSFKAGCSSPADCLAPAQPQPPPPPPPNINYLARDYDGFRQVMLDRIAVLAPDWTERHAADLGIALVEALAYAADHISYAQDAIGTEAYIGTARSRIWLRRHARLVDYTIGEGCTARTLIAVTTALESLLLPARTMFYPAAPGLPTAGSSTNPLALILADTVPPFAAIQPAPLFKEQNEIPFYTWADGDCCLPAGATSATLTGHLTSLLVGGMLVLEEVIGPSTGVPEDADPAHRHAVMLTGVRFNDRSGASLADPLTGTLITEVSWADADALPFPLYLRTTVAGTPVTDVSVARGNIVLADHGAFAEPEQLPAVSTAGRYWPTVGQSPVSFGIPMDVPSSAASFLAEDPSHALPLISLTDSEGNPWEPRQDLLTAGSADRCFVVEVERDGKAFLRFGDGEHGARPDPGLTFTAVCRVGIGTAGNVGHDALGHAVVPAAVAPFPAWAITRVRNPLPVTSGVDPEPMDHIRQSAPFKFHQQERCVTEADYGQQAALLRGVSLARGELRWTGSWYTAFIAADPGIDDPAPLDRLRMMGTDVAAEAAIIVGLRIALAICVDAAHFRGDVQVALMARFTGPGGILNAGNFTFGQTIYASPLIAAAQAVEGVTSVTLATFSRLDMPWVDGIADGFLTLGRLEIPRCDNDPDHLDHGLFTVTLDGGK